MRMMIGTTNHNHQTSQACLINPLRDQTFFIRSGKEGIRTKQISPQSQGVLEMLRNIKWDLIRRVAIYNKETCFRSRVFSVGSLQ